MTTEGLGKRIKTYRKEKSLTQAQFAAEADLSAAYVSELENDVAKRPSGQVLMQLATALGVTVADLLGTTKPPSSAALPNGLAEFAEARGLPQVDIEMLAAIRFRGEQPRSARRWAYIYDTISSSQSLDEDS